MRMAMKVEYLGTAFQGFQKQNQHQNTIQHHLEQAISQVANHPVDIFCAGRTDAGVHAYGQVIHFESSAERSLKQWQQGVNHYLPPAIRITTVRHMPAHFHARFSAIARHYCYFFHKQEPSVFSTMGHAPLPMIDWQSAQITEALQALLGEHDFSSFRTLGCQAKSPVRRMYIAEHISTPTYDILHFAANGFLYHMVRQLVSVLLHIAQGKISMTAFHDLLEDPDPMKFTTMMPSSGLVFMGVEYRPGAQWLPFQLTWPGNC